MEGLPQNVDPRIAEIAKQNPSVHASLCWMHEYGQGITEREQAVQVALILHAQCQTYHKICVDLASVVKAT